MTETMSGTWLFVAVATGAVSTAMVVYGIKQKEPLPLVFGIAFGAVPMLVSSGIGALAISLGLAVLFFLARKYR